MNTTAKGDKFEDKVYKVFRGLLEDNRLPVNSQQSIIKQKAKYFSQARNNYIITDISIETTMDISSSYNTLTIIECKDCNRPTPVDDVEEFHAKLSQIKAHKGFMISRHGFQQSAITVAEHYHIGLIRMNDDGTLLSIANREVKSYSLQRARTLLSDATISSGQFVILNAGKSYNSLIDLFEDLRLIQRKSKNNIVPYLTPEDIKAKVELLAVSHCYNNGCLDIQSLCEHFTSQNNIQFEHQLLDTRILGRTDFKNKTIILNSRLKCDEHRYRFTIAHEIGHFILHKHLHSTFEETNCSQNILAKERLSNNDIMEYQANVFAEHLLLPLNELKVAFAKFMLQEGITKLPIYIDNQQCNISLGYKACSYIGDKFNVSKQMAKIALKHNNLLKDASNFIDRLREMKTPSLSNF